MHQKWIASMEQPRGPVFSSRVRANYQLAWRKAQREGVRINEIQGRLSSGLAPELTKTGPPSERRAREWIQDRPDFPERMLGLGVVNEGDILADLRPYLQAGYSDASMAQTGRDRAGRDPGIGSGLSGFLAALVLAGAAILLANQIRRPRPAPRSLRYASNQTMKGLRPVSGSFMSYPR